MLTELTEKRIKHVNNKEKLLGIGMKTVISDLIKKEKKSAVLELWLFVSCFSLVQNAHLTSLIRKCLIKSESDR